MKVLLVSNVRPDDPGGRAEKLADRQQYLAENGIEIIFGHVPEPYFRSFLPAIVRIARLGRREDVDVVTSVSNPFHLQLVGYVVSRVLGVPWLVEFRDPMVESPDRDPDAFLTRVAGFVERLAVRRSAAVVWGDGIQIPDGYYTDRYDVPDDHVTKLPFHGFDPAAFEVVDPVAHHTFTITYAGSFYEGWIEPFEFFQGLARYRESDVDDLIVQFYGDWDQRHEEKARALGVRDLVRTHEFVPHEKVVAELKGSDAALYVGGTDPDNRYNVPSKIWDYVGARVPILAVVDPEFRVTRLIEQYDLGIVVDPRDPSAIAEGIEALHTGTYEYAPDPETFDRFTRDRKLEQYRAILHGLVSPEDIGSEIPTSSS